MFLNMLFKYNTQQLTFNQLSVILEFELEIAPMVELVDTLVLEASAERRRSSSLLWGTT